MLQRTMIWGTDVNVQDTQALFRHFFENFVEPGAEAGMLKYVRLLDAAARSGRGHLNLDCQDLLAVPATVRLYGDLVRYPQEVIPIFDDVVNTLYLEAYGEPTRSRNAAYLRKRLSWRLQELRFGGLSEGAVAAIERHGDQLPELWRKRLLDFSAKVKPDPQVPVLTRDPRLPPIGTVLRRVYRNDTHEVTVRNDGFEYRGQAFKTLSAVARRITGTPWNGFKFFNVGVTTNE
jgi:hypothetical protein